MKLDKTYGMSVLLIGLPLIFIALIAGVFFYTSSYRRPPEVLDVSVITRGAQNAYWESVKQGMDKAAYDMNIDLSFITMLNENDENEQLAAVQRELDNKAQALVIVPATETVITQAADSKAIVVEMESSLENPKITANVLADNIGMGEAIADEIIAFYKPAARVVMIKPEPAPPAIAERIEGLMNRLNDNGIEMLIWQVPVQPMDAAELIKSHIVLEGADIIAAVDSQNLLNVARVVSSLDNSEIKVFGIESTAELVSFIENGVVESLVAQNSFTFGYLSIQAAAKAIRGEKFQRKMDIDYTVIKQDNLYSPENQRLLFPFIR